MAKLYYSNNPLEKQEHKRRREWKYRLNKALLFLSLTLNFILLAHVIIRAIAGGAP